MACITFPLSPESRVFCSVRCLAVASALLVAAGGLTHYELMGTGIPQLLAILGMCGVWIYNLTLLNTTWVKEDGSLADYDLTRVRELRACDMAKSWLLFDLGATFLIVMPILANASFMVPARGLFLLQLWAFIRTQKRIAEEEEAESSGDVEEGRKSVPSGSVAQDPDVVGRPADETLPSEMPVVSTQAVIVNCSPQGTLTNADGSCPSPQKEHATVDVEAAPVPC